jgi:hypothetical protein
VHNEKGCGFLEPINIKECLGIEFGIFSGFRQSPNHRAPRAVVKLSARNRVLSLLVGEISAIYPKLEYERLAKTQRIKTETDCSRSLSLNLFASIRVISGLTAFLVRPYP